MGLPIFFFSEIVEELIRCVPITKHCRRHRLNRLVARQDIGVRRTYQAK